MRKNFHDPEQELVFHKHRHKPRGWGGGCSGFVILKMSEEGETYGSYEECRVKKKKKAVTVRLTHHEHQFPHVGPGEVVQQLPHGAHVLQHTHTHTQSTIKEMKHKCHLSAVNRNATVLFVWCHRLRLVLIR